MGKQNNVRTEDERAIRELVQTWMTATKAGDIQTVLSLMTDDVTFMTPGTEPFGKEAFATTAEQMKNVLQVLEDPSSPFPESKLTLRRITKVMQQAEAWSTGSAIRSPYCARNPTGVGELPAMPIY